jgi:uncharacterized protein (DUF1330 family)
MNTRVKTIVALVIGFASGAAAVEAVRAQAKPPAYTIAEVEVTDQATYQEYQKGARVEIPAAGGRFITRGGRTFVVNGAPPKRVVLLQWESFEKAQAFFESEAYKRLVPVRDKSSNFRAFIVEGVAN